MLKPGQMLGSYQITAAIAGGGMGMVYRARHQVLGRDAAIKVLLPNLAMKDTVRYRFRQEAYVQAQLQWPGIVSIQDFIQQDDLLAMVMEFVDGPTLDQVLGVERPGPWEPNEVIRVMTPILAAMAYAHRRRVVHRDLKPANVMLDRAGGPPWPGIAKITDFGLAKLLEAETGMTVLGSRMGTIPYMAPEQYAGKKEITPAADVYALGMFLYRMLTGELPHDPDDQLTGSQIYLGAQKIPSVLEKAPGTPPGLANVVEAALAHKFADRIPDAQALAEALGIDYQLATSSMGSSFPTNWGSQPPAPGSHPPTPGSQPPTWGSQPPAPGSQPPTWGSQPPAPGSQPPAPGSQPPAPQSQPPAQPLQQAAPPTQTPGSDSPDDDDIPLPAPRSKAPLIAGGIGAAVLLLIVVGVGISKHNAAKEAERLAQAAISSRKLATDVSDALELYKVDHDANKDDQMLARALIDAHKAMDLSETTEAVGMVALTEVWAHQWHYGSAKWNESYFRDDDAITRKAMEQPTPEGALARALLISNACRVASDADKRRDELCNQVAGAYEKANSLLASDSRAWLRFEAAWTEAMFYREMGDQMEEAGNSSKAKSYRRQVDDICDRGSRDLNAAPVNDRYLAKHCMVAAARRDDFKDYFKWARWLRSDDVRDFGQYYKATVKSIFFAPAEECVSGLSFRGSAWKVKPQPNTKMEYLCASAGYLALGCRSDGAAHYGLAQRAGVNASTLRLLDNGYSSTRDACYYK